MVEPILSDEELLRQIESARQADRAADLEEPRARDAWYDRASGRVVVELRQGGAFAFPADLYPELAVRAPEELEAVQPSPSGEGLDWDALDIHVDVAGVLVRMLGPAMLRAFAARGGASTSERKAAAARANGARGGRPRKDTLRREVPRPGALRARETWQPELTQPESPRDAFAPRDDEPPPKPRRGRRKPSAE